MQTNIINNENGFSIVEMLIALAILAIGMLAVARMQVLTVKNTTIGNMTTQATMLAQARMEELKSVQDLTDLDALPVPDVEADIDADGNAGGIYTRTTTITVPAAPLDDDLRGLRVEVRWESAHGGARAVTLNSITHGNGI